MMPVETTLRGRTVGVTAQRRGDDQAVMWRRMGAEVLHGPAIASVPAADPDGLRATVAGLIASPPTWMVANTGYGIRALFVLVESWGLADDLRAALAGSRIVARGPKAAGAVRSVGLDLDWRSPSEQLPEVADYLIEHGVAGTTVAFQLHGADAGDFTGTLEASGATIVVLPIYRWIRPGDDEPALKLIAACCAGRVQALTFTSAPGVRNFMAVAEDAGLSERLVEVANTSMVVGCVGPVCATAATEEGFVGLIVPDHWRLGSMVKVVAEALAVRRG